MAHGKGAEFNLGVSLLSLKKAALLVENFKFFFFSQIY
jgi:hypothetical protein